MNVEREIGVVRVSRYDDGLSPAEQREKIAADAKANGRRVVDIIEELDVSGGTPLDRRDGLRRAVEAVEAGRADTIVVAYFDRLVRSLTVQAEVVSRVEAAGGRIRALDIGDVRSDTAGSWLSSTMLGMVAEYTRRSIGERSKASQARAIADGIAPFPRIPIGLRRRPDRKLEPDPATAPFIQEAFALRADGASVTSIRDWLAGNGIDIRTAALTALFRNRMMVGELKFGGWTNPAAWEPVIDRDTFDRVQRMVVPRGRRAKSPMLLARLGVLRCHSCGGRLTVKTRDDGSRKYHCAKRPGECSHRVTISAPWVERLVMEQTKIALADIHGRAEGDAELDAARTAAEQAQERLTNAVRAFDGLGDLDAAREQLARLKADADAAAQVYDDLRNVIIPVGTFDADDLDAPDVTDDDRRLAIRSAIARVVVFPSGRAGRVLDEGRVQVWLRGQDAPLALAG